MRAFQVTGSKRKDRIIEVDFSEIEESAEHHAHWTVKVIDDRNAPYNTHPIGKTYSLTIQSYCMFNENGICLRSGEKYKGNAPNLPWG